MLSDQSVVVWDLGNVLIPWDRTGALMSAVGDLAEAQRLAEEVFTLEVNRLLDAGESLDRVLETVEAAHPGTSWVVQAYVEHFGDSLGPLIEGSATVVRELLRRDVRCIGLSNWSTITFEGVPEAYPLLRELEGILISGEVGITKPDPEIFMICSSRFDFEPSDAVFIDDNRDNVDSAGSLGWTGLHFQSPQQIRTALVEIGLLDPVRPRPLG